MLSSKLYTISYTITSKLGIQPETLHKNTPGIQPETLHKEECRPSP